MRKLKTRMAVCMLTVTSVIAGSFNAAAAEAVSSTNSYPATGLSALIDNYCDSDSKLPSVGVTSAIDEYVKAIIDTDLVATVSQVKDEYKTMVVAQVEGFLNVRKEADINSEVVGKLQNNSAANIVGVTGDWYKITSGTVTGYVLREYVVFGKSAESIADKVSEKIGTVKADALNIRSAADVSATVVDVMVQGNQCTVISDNGTWKQVRHNGKTGYVLGEYLDIQTKMETAESKNEEATRLAAEEAEKLAGIAKSASSSSSAYKAANEAKDASDRATTIADGDTTEKTTKYASDAQYYSSLAKQYADQLAIAEAEAAEAARKAAAEAAAAEAARKAAAEAAAKSSRKANSSSNSNRQNTSSSNSSKSQSSQNNKKNNNNNNNYNSASSYSNSSKGQQIANYALQFVGNPYVWGGTSLTNGADCSGFVKSVMSDCGVSVSGRTASSQSGGGTIVSEGSLQPGDLVFYASGGKVYHVAIYIGGGKVVHAASTSLGICVSSYNYATPYKCVRYY